MAGESPDGSKRERSSGETTENTPAVPPEAEESATTPPAADASAASADPRVAAYGAADGADEDAGADADADAGSGGDARLRAAVAAWVSTSGESGGTGEADDTADDAADDTAEKRPTAPKVDNPTAMFGVLRPEERATEADPETAAQQRAELLTNAYFGSGRRPSAGSGGASGTDEASDRTSPSAEPEAAGGTPGATGTRASGTGASEPAEGASSPEQGTSEQGKKTDGPPAAAKKAARKPRPKPSATEGAGDAADPADASAPTGRKTARPKAKSAEGAGKKAARPAAKKAGAKAAPGAKKPAPDAGTDAADDSASDGSQPPATTDPRPSGDVPAGKRESSSDTTSLGGKPSDGKPEGGKTPPADDGAGAAGKRESSSDTTSLGGKPSSVESGPEAKAPGGEQGSSGGAAGAAAAGKRESGSDTTSLGGKTPGRKTPPADAGAGAPGKRESSSDTTSLGGKPSDANAPKSPESGKVDQPTTAIRVPKKDRDAAAAKAVPAAKEPEKPEEPKASERTSQFIPLKSADGPPRPTVPPQPLPAESATPAPAAPPAAPAAPPTPPPAVPPTPARPLADPPPLDLLAQLTNKPAPPETPMRTAVRRVKIWTPLLLLLAIAFVIAQVVRPLPDSSLAMTAPASYAFEGEKPNMPWPSEGQAYVEVSGLGSLGSYGKQTQPVPIGSVAKTMTAYVVLKNHQLKQNEPGPPLTVDKKAEEDGRLGEGNGGESVLDTVKEGDKLSLRDSIAAVMIPSANNIARLLARWHSDGSEKKFVAEMNEAAKDLGMKNTEYTDPSGLRESTVSTAADQVKLAKKVMEIPALVDITKLPTWTDPSGRQWRNYNTVVPFDGAIGIKTGSTTKAGGNLLFAGRKEIGGTTQLIVGAVLGQHKPPIIDTANAASKELLIAAGGTLAASKVVKKGDVVGEVDDGLGGRTPVVATKDVTAVGWSGLKVKLALEAAKKGIPQTAEAGEKVGTLTVGDGPGQVKVPVALQEDLVEPGFGDKVTRIL